MSTTNVKQRIKTFNIQELHRNGGQQKHVAYLTRCVGGTLRLLCNKNSESIRY
ncbi:MAG: hypothetical protein ABFS56_07095 [Pseudomonadota bacterium]